MVNYTVMVIFEPSYGGGSALEHQSSHVGIYNPQFIGTPILPSITAHEIFHAWNVKRLRPAELWPYRYDQAQPTSWLWVSEGITDYYADLALVRGGIVDSTGWLDFTQQKVTEVAASPPVALEPRRTLHLENDIRAILRRTELAAFEVVGHECREGRTHPRKGRRIIPHVEEGLVPCHQPKLGIERHDPLPHAVQNPLQHTRFLGQFGFAALQIGGNPPPLFRLAFRCRLLAPQPVDLIDQFAQCGLELSGQCPDFIPPG